MSEREITKEAVDKDWAVLPFDEEQDDKRWDKLIKETEELEREVVRHEAVHGKLLMEEPFSEIQPEIRQVDIKDLF